MTLIDKAREFAIIKHGDQKYGIEPYKVHLDHVFNIFQSLGVNNEIVGIGCYLHDVLEDTDCTFEEIWKEFGWEVAQLVFLVTDEPGKNRKERKQKTYPKINTSVNAILLKFCDRLANIQESKNNNPGLFEMYRKEHAEFMSHYRESLIFSLALTELALKLDNLFENEQ